MGKPSAISQITYYTNNPQFPLLMYLFSPLFPIPTGTTAYFAPRYLYNLSDAEKSPELFFLPRRTEKTGKTIQEKPNKNRNFELAEIWILPTADTRVSPRRNFRAGPIRKNRKTQKTVCVVTNLDDPKEIQHGDRKFSLYCARLSDSPPRSGFPRVS